MPLPRGIYSSPEVRRAWITERKTKLDEFDLLISKGTPPRKAALTLHLTVPGVRAMRTGLETMDERTTGRAKGSRIDLGLALLSVANPPGEERQALTARDIAAWCGCSHAAIQSIERRALAKLHRKLDALRREQVIPSNFGGELPSPRLAVAA